MSGITMKEKKVRQVRFESVFTTELEGEDLNIFMNELTGEICGHLENGSGEEHIISAIMSMDDVSEEESTRLQELYAKAVGEGGLELSAGRAEPMSTRRR